MLRIAVQAEPFNAAAELAAIATHECGGTGCFIGTVRAEPNLAALHLEHYPAMTAPALHAIAEAAATRWPLLGVTLIHRIGRLPVGEPIVLVIAASRHRAAALSATAFLIDWLKTDAPFWKCEEFADGTRHWVDAKTSDATARAGWTA